MAKMTLERCLGKDFARSMAKKSDKKKSRKGKRK